MSKMAVIYWSMSGNTEAMAGAVAQGARDAGVPLIHHCNTREEAKALLPQLVRPDATFLVKASRGMKLEELTGALLELTRDPGEG